MNKRIISAAVAVGLLLGSVTALPQQNKAVQTLTLSASAQVSGAWSYDLLSDGTASLTAYSGSDSELAIPKTVGGKTVTALGDALFAGNTKLVSVSIPSTVKSVGGSAFAGCTKLKSVTVPSSVTTLGSENHGFVFSGCKSLESIKLPSGLTAIEDGLFQGCEKLTSIAVPSTVTRIGSSAFGGCTGLKTITLPASVSSVDDFAFDGCTQLESINVDEKNKIYCSTDGVLYNKSKTRLVRCPSAKPSITIPSSVSEISPASFNDNKKLSSVIIPGSVSVIGDMAFKGCTALKSILVNGSNKFYSSFDGVLYNKDKSALVCCPSAKTDLTSVPASVSEISSGAFYGSGLKSITLAEGVEKIGEYAFAHSALTKIEIPQSTENIGRSAFYSCAQLTEVTLSKGVKEIGSMAFADCPKLTSVFVPQTVSSIGSGALGVTSSSQQAQVPIKGFVLYCEKSADEAVRYAKATGLSCKTTADYSRLAGASRYATAAAISKESFKTADTVIIAYGLNYADALAGVPLAAAYNSPILLTNKNALPSETLAEIKRLGATQAIILGGEGAVGTQIESALSQNGFAKGSIRRIAGKTRFETAAKIAEELESVTGKAPTQAFLVYYDSYADALSASTVAAAEGAPILYVATNGELNEYTQGALENVSESVQNAYVIGGTGVISDELAQLAGKALGGKTVERVAGQNRYKTCAAVNEKFASVLTGSSVCVAKGLDFPDALAGGVFAALGKMPLFLADGSLGDEQKQYLKSKKADSYYVLGGVGAVSERVIQLVCKASV